MRKKSICLICISTFMLLSGCGMDNQDSGADYKETKSMVIDILKTEEAKKAIEEATQGGEMDKDQAKIMQMLKSPEGEQIQLAVKDILTDPSYPSQIKEMMTDPKFAGEFAKVIQEEDKQLHKELLKDPEYQTQLIETLNTKEYKEIVFELLKSPDYKKQTMTVMQEAIENPIFRIELMKLMKKVIEEESKPKLESKGSKKEEEKKKKEEKS